MPSTRTSVISPDQFATFGELLKFLRRRAGLTQRELAIAVGYSPSQISRLEQNERPPDAASLAARFVPALNLEPDWAARLLELAAISRAAVQQPATHRATAAPAPPHNLPLQRTSFIGRELEIAQGQRLLGSSPLVTLTGTGGAGKSRLSLEIAARVLNDFPDGAWLVELAPLADPALVPQAVASVLGVPEQPGRPILATLTTYLRGRTMLLVLDNCEHLIHACARLAEAVLAACPNIRLLATSREALDLAGETTLAVPPLSSPNADHGGSVDALAPYEAVQLFVDRAAAALHGFALTPANAPAVAEVCRQLDGLPLAIEMAAARVKLLRVQQIAERLNDRFQLLTAARRTALPRHQTLAAVIDWSYDLLSEPERALLRRLAVFAGGWMLDAAEAVCGDEPNRIGSTAVLDLLTGLVNKSLVVAERLAGQETRYHCLETIRQYALPKLAASGEEAATRRRHAHYYRALAETVEPLLFTADERRWLDRLEAELANLRAAVAYCQTATGDPEEGLRLASTLREFWGTRGSVSEGRAWLRVGLESEGAVSDAIRVKALDCSGWLAEMSSDFPAAEQNFEAGMRISRKSDDRSGLAWALCGLGTVAWYRREDEPAHDLLAESLAIFRELGDEFGMAYPLCFLGDVARARGDFEAAHPYYAESLRLAQQFGHVGSLAYMYMDMAHLERAESNDAQAAVYYDQALVMYRELGNTGEVAECLIGLAQLAHNQGDNDRAKLLLAEALVIIGELDGKALLGFCLAGFGGVAVAQRQPLMGVRLLSAAAAGFDAIGRRMPVATQAEYDRDLALAREQLDEAGFAAAWAEGQAMAPEQAVALALQL